MKKALFIVLAAALVLAGCKGNDESSTASSADTTATPVQGTEPSADSEADKNSDASEADKPSDGGTTTKAAEGEIPFEPEDDSSTELDILPIDDGQRTTTASPDAPAPDGDKGTTTAAAQKETAPAQTSPDGKPASTKQTDKAPASTDANTQSKTQSETKPATERKKTVPPVDPAPGNSEYELPIVPVV